MGERGGTDPDIIWSHSRCGLLRCRQLVVRRRCRMDDERLCIANIRDEARQPERIDHLAAHRGIPTALYAEIQHSTKRAWPSERRERQRVGRVRLEAQVGDPGHLFVLFEVSRERERVVRVPLRPERERLEALQKEKRRDWAQRGP